MTAILFGSVLPWLLVVAGAWLVYQLVRQNGRILLRLESIERKVSRQTANQQPKPGGLPLGSAAPDFELPDLAGDLRTLSEFRGKVLTLIFFNPQCGFCTQMADDLAALPIDGAEGRPLPVVIATGDAEENRRLVEKHGIRCTVLLQEKMEIGSKYRAQGTPTGYRIDAAGRIASELAVGAEPLLRLAANRSPDQAAPKTNGKGRPADPSLARSRLQRDGLKAGGPAPEFRLPRLDGGEFSLAELRGRRVLLAFSDPDCGPCEELAPQLEDLYRNRSDLQIVVVSRRDADANREKARELGLTFPIVLQKQWEVSLKYGMFATPIGYLIDEQGILLSDVAVGVEPILALANLEDPPMPDHSEPASVGPRSVAVN